MIFEVLMYLFENYMDGSVTLKADEDTIIRELEEAGYNRFEVGRALNWLDELTRVQKIVQTQSFFTSSAIRCYTPDECEHLSKESRGLLIYLEQLGILDPITREIVIDRLMALDYREINTGRIKWVVLIVLCSQPDKKSALTLLQDMILTDVFDVLH